jgi:hypothetical protein
MLQFEWQELRDVLEDLAASPAQKDRVRSLVGGLSKLARGLSRPELLKLVLMAGHLTLSEDPQPEIDAALSEFPDH